MIDFFTLTPQQFEDLCFEYANKIYDSNKYALFHTNYRHDGGRDIEVNFYDELHRYKIWAECKHIKRNIGLEEIGKNVVLVIANHVNKILFFSASSIRESAKYEIMKIASRLNFSVSFLDNEHLRAELCRLPQLAERYFKISIEQKESNYENRLSIDVRVSENETNELSNLAESKVFLRLGKIFYINIFIKNITPNYFSDFNAELINIPDSISFLERIGLEDDSEIIPYSDYIVSFICSITHSDWITTPLPELIVNYKIGNEMLYDEFTLPMLDLSKNAINPFIGKVYIEFIASNVPSIISLSKNSVPQIIDIRGKSGVGKSRVADELKIAFLKSGTMVNYYDSNDYSDLNLIRKLLCDILGIPFNQTMVSYNIEDIETVVSKYDEAGLFTQDVAKFIYKAEYNDKNQIILIQAMEKILHLHCEKRAVLITIDNIQENGLYFYNIMQNIITVLSQSNIKISLCLITNTEYIPKESIIRCTKFLDYLDIQLKSKLNQFTLFMCNGFSQTDVTLFWMMSLNRSNYKDEIINRLALHFGDNPLEVITASDYLKKSQILSQNDIAEWHLVNEQELRSLFENNFNTYDQIFKKKFKYFLQSLKQVLANEIKKIVSAVVMFRNKVTLSFFYFINLDMETIDLLVEQKILRYHIENNYVSFYHDSIYRYFNSQSSYRNNYVVAQEAVNFIVQKKPDNAPMLLFQAYFHTDELEKSKELGLELIKSKISDFQYIEAIEIGRLIFNNEFFKKDIPYYLECAMLYAYSLSCNGNKDYSCEVFMQLCPIVYQHQDCLDPIRVCEFYRDAVNSQLQSFRFKESADVIRYYEKILNMSLKYQFILKNREGVVYLSLNNFVDAEKSFQESLDIAESICDIGERRFWTSTTHSDIALLHFYNVPTHENKEACIESFEKAINDYDKCIDGTIFRHNEILWHKAFINILRGKYEEAIQILDNALADKMTYSIFTFYRLNNLKALSLIYLKDYTKAEDILLTVKSQCEVNNFESGVIRLYNNLGVLYWEMNQKEKAHEYFKLSINQLPADKISLKFFPVISNNFVIAKFIDTDRLARIENIIKTTKDVRLIEYSLSAKKIKTLEQCQGICMWNFQGLDYIY